VTAVNNGLELIAEGDSGIAAEAVGLIRQSAGEASRKLQFYRLAYGQAAGFEEARGLIQAKELAAGLFQGGKITLVWSDGAQPAAKPAVKFLLNLVCLAREALPRGGEIAVNLTHAGAMQIEVTAKGTNARLSPEVLAAMAKDANAEQLTPRTVHAYLVSWLGEGLGAGLAVDTATPDRVVFRARV
jgi:histidine phosphotransferase ChpT